MKNNQINNFFVGELYLSYPMIENEKQIISRDKIKNEMIAQGAIPLSNKLIIDWQKNIKYLGFLTIFYKTSGCNYICLHNMNSYSKKRDDYYKNLMPIKELLPKVDYSIVDTLSFNQAKNLFSDLFHKNTSKYAKNNIYKIEDFYIGNLSLFTDKEQKIIGFKNKQIFYNVPIMYLTINSDATMNGGFMKKNYNKDYYYITFSCLFLKNQNNSMYNVNNYQTYKIGTLNNCNYESFLLEDNFYDNMVPMIEMLKENNISYKKENISMDKALVLQKQINKKTYQQ